MTKVHGKRYAYKFDFQGLAASLQPQPDQGAFVPDYKNAIYRQDLAFAHPAGHPYHPMGHPGSSFMPHHTKNPFIPAGHGRSPPYQAHPVSMGSQYGWHPDISNYPSVPNLPGAPSQALPPTSFYN